MLYKDWLKSFVTFMEGVRLERWNLMQRTTYVKNKSRIIHFYFHNYVIPINNMEQIYPQFNEYSIMI